MVATEKTYLEDLIAVVDGYWGYMRESKNADEESDMISMPIDLRDGKDEIAVSMPTTEKLYKFHKGYDFKFQCSCFYEMVLVCIKLIVRLNFPDQYYPGCRKCRLIPNSLNIYSAAKKKNSRDYTGNSR